MKFKGLSGKVWQGDADVYDRSRPCPLLQSCGRCKYCHHTYYICPRAHVICKDCQGKVRGTGEYAPCRTCNSQASRINVPVSLVDNIDFSCGCGFLGTLADIKAHRLKDLTAECDEKREPEDPIMLELCDDLSEVDVALAKMKKEVQATLDRLRCVVTGHGVESAPSKKIEDLTLKIKDLERRSDKVLDDYHDLQAQNHQIRSLLDTVLSPSMLRSFAVERILKEGLEEKRIITQSMYVEMRIALNDQGSADLFIRASFRKGFRTPKDVIGKTLVVRHLDANGYILRDVSFKVKPNGSINEMQYDLPEAFHPQLLTYRKVPKFIDHGRLFGPAVEISDWAHIAVGLYS